MATVQGIIDFADRKFLSAETIANKVSDINDIYIGVYIEINRLKNETEIYELTTVADQPTYSLPSNCRMENIESIVISTDVDGTEFESVEYIGLNNSLPSIGKYYGRATDGTFFLFADALPIQTTGLIVRIYYYKRPTLLSESSLSTIPELDSDYHDLLKFGLIQSLASQGLDSKTDIADYWQGQYDKKLQKVTKALSERYSAAPTQRSQVRERM
jgi:hypothetical protein